MPTHPADVVGGRWEDPRPGLATVLVVDDDPSVLAMLSMALEAEGYHVQRAASGQQALALITELPPDVVVLDVMLPGLDGREVTRQLRSDPATRDLPIVICSARAGDGDQWEAWMAGANSFVGKPFEFDLLVSEIDQAVRGSVAIRD